MKKQTFWMPIDKDGSFWNLWSSNTRKKVLAMLNANYVSWREAGLKVIKVTISPVKKARNKNGK